MKNAWAAEVSLNETADGYEFVGANLNPPPKLLRNIKGIIFDFDGTLFDNVFFPFYIIKGFPWRVIRVWRERLIRKRFAGRDFTSSEKYYRAFFSAYGKASSCSPERIRNWYYNRYIPRMIRVLKKYYKPRPGAVELLRCFDSPAATLPKIAIYSDYPSLKQRMEALGISPGPNIFLYGPESFGAQKPAARPFRRIAEIFGIAPEEVLVIGDREDTDGLGAFKAGMRFFCVETGRRRYFRLDPYRSFPEKKEKPHGPSLLMYAGPWDSLVKLLLESYGSIS